MCCFIIRIPLSSLSKCANYLRRNPGFENVANWGNRYIKHHSYLACADFDSADHFTDEASILTASEAVTE